MNVAYLRVSTVDQNLARQEEAMLKAGVAREDFFEEKISGKNMERPALKAMLSYIHKEDVVFVESISRLARSAKDLLTIVDEIKGKGAYLVCLKENIDTRPKIKGADGTEKDNTNMSQFILTVFAAISELERNNILERQAEGIAIAKANHVYKGRKPVEKPENWDEVIKLLEDGEITAKVAMRKMNLKPTTFYKFKKEEDESKQ